MQINKNWIRQNTPTLLLAAIIVSVVILSRLLYAPCDDAYIFLVYAKNFLHGNGLTFNGTLVEGFSSPLWMALLMIFGVLRVPLPFLMQALSTISGIFALLATYLLAQQFLKDRSWSLLPVLLLAGSGDFIFYLGSGLEQVLFTGLIALSLAWFWADPQNSLKEFRLALSLALLILTRPEGGLFALLVLIWGLLHTRSVLLPFLAGLKITALLAPVLLLKRLYFGYWLPNTYYVKSNSGLVNMDLGKIYLIRNSLRYWPIAALLIIFLLVLVWQKKSKAVGTPLPLAAISAVWAGYIWLVGGDNLVGGRLLLPVLPLIAVGLIFIIQKSLTRFDWAAGLILLAAIGTYLGFTQDSLVTAHIQRWRRNFPVRQAAGLYLKENFPPNTLVALNPAGIIPFYSQQPTIDMLGLNDIFIGHSGKRDYSLDFGHQAGDGHYVLSQKPDVILFGGGVSPRPGDLISDREIAIHPEFASLYQSVVWPGIGTAFLRTAP